MKTIKKVNIKKRQNYFFNDMANIGDFDPSLLNVYSIEFKSSNSPYLVFNNLDVCIEKSGENKYLIFASTDKNGMILEDYTEICNEIKEQIDLISGSKVIKYSRDFMKIKFQSDDGLPLGKILNIPVSAIIVKGVFQEDSKYYPQVLL